MSKRCIVGNNVFCPIEDIYHLPSPTQGRHPVSRVTLECELGGLFCVSLGHSSTGVFPRVFPRRLFVLLLSRLTRTETCFWFWQQICQSGEDQLFKMYSPCLCISESSGNFREVSFGSDLFLMLVWSRRFGKDDVGLYSRCWFVWEEPLDVFLMYVLIWAKRIHLTFSWYLCKKVFWHIYSWFRLVKNDLR